MKARNYVHKHAYKFNRATVQVDRKKDLKRGKAKHKGTSYDRNTILNKILFL